jgi:hypothetical protein
MAPVTIQAKGLLMYLNPIWSVLVLAAVFALYWFVIRPRAPFLEVGRGMLDRLHRFRSYVATFMAALLVAAPDIIVAITPADLSNIIGPKWVPTIMSALAIYLAVNRAFSTRPPGEKL